MDNFSEELFAKIKSIQALLKGGADPCASTLNLCADVDLATLADQDVVTLTQKIEKINEIIKSIMAQAASERKKWIDEAIDNHKTNKHLAIHSGLDDDGRPYRVL